MLKKGRSLAMLAPTATLLAWLMAGCDNPSVSSKEYDGGGDPERGAQLIDKIGCGGCHIIPGIEGAKGLVGPPLNHMGKRVYIAGVLRNTTENMITWLRNPQEVVPNNAMPNMGLSGEEARDIAAYLHTLE